MDGPLVDFVPLTRADFALLATWLAEPMVERWWHDDASLAGIEALYGASIDGADPTEVFVATVDSAPLGLIQRYRIADEPDFGAELNAVYAVPAGALALDYLIGDPARRGRGLGIALVSTFLARSWRERTDARSFVVPVAAANTVSQRTLERAGFRRVATGPMTPDNPIDPPDHVIFRADRPAGS